MSVDEDAYEMRRFEGTSACAFRISSFQRPLTQAARARSESVGRATGIARPACRQLVPSNLLVYVKEKLGSSGKV